MKATIAMNIALIPSILLGFISFSYAGEISTTRLKSTAGTGVGTLLMDEATVLNPAAISFFQNSSFYLQKTGADLTTADNSPLSDASEDDLMFAASDAKGVVDGSVSYVRSKDRYGKSSRLAASMSSAVGEKSAMGFSYSMTDRDGGPLKGKMKQITAGVTHAISREFTMGVVVPDVLGENELERRAIVGFQYLYKDFIALMLDAGADWEREASESSLIRAAIQLKVFDDFYARFGAQEDKGLKRKGTGAGIGWVQPRLVIEAAMARTEYSEIEAIGQVDETAKETSFSLSYHF